MEKTPTIRQSPSLSIPKVLKVFVKISDKLSKRFTTKVATWLFTLPRNYKRPTREDHMFYQSKREKLYVQSIKKTIQVYTYGDRQKPKMLLVHGWAGRGTQMSDIATDFLDQYQIVSFDGPAHGYSSGKRTNFLEFVEVVKSLDKQHQFNHCIAHSMGGAVMLFYCKHFRPIPYITTIGAPNHIRSIFTSFVIAFDLDKSYVDRIRNMFNTFLEHELEHLDGSAHAELFKGHLQIVHDTDDMDVGIQSAKELHTAYKQSQILITSGYGHRRILRNKEVLSKIKSFHIKKS